MIDHEEYVGSSIESRVLRHLIKELASKEETVLIRGETGVGKDVVANLLHKRSSRATGPFIPVGCTDIAESLVESELFGHEKGAYSGAHSSRKGLFESAINGTLFLDEIGDMPLSLQAKLLRFLGDAHNGAKEFRTVGDSKTRKVDVRVIAATHQDLEDLVKKGQFRKDLYFRLNVFPINILPLRERKEDIPDLLKYVEKEMVFSKEALSKLNKYSWPGNTREFINTIRASSFSAKFRNASAVMPEDIVFSSLYSETESLGTKNTKSIDHEIMENVFVKGMGLRDLVKLYKYRVIELVVDECKGNITKTAQALDTERSNIHRYLSKMSKKS